MVKQQRDDFVLFSFPAMEADTMETKPGTVTVVVIDEKTGRFVLVMNPGERRPAWNFPGGPILSEDVDPNRPLDIHAQADNAARRTVKKKTGLEVNLQRIRMIPREGIGVLYIYAGLANFEGLVETSADARRVVKSFSSPEEIRQLRAPSLYCTHHSALNAVLKVIGA